MLSTILVVSITFTSSLCQSIISGLQKTPPAPKYGANNLIKSLTPKINNNHGYIWEKSGLYQGDIAIYESDRNGLIDHSFRWPNATIPFYIDEKHFNDTEIKIILSAAKEFNTKTCLRLKPYDSTDENWVTITGNERGCWSSVGSKGKSGQQLNVFSPNCVHKGVVEHELLHAAGFYHQQSASDRDEYVEILWDNIEENHASNFNKYNSSVVTDFGVGYDFDSIMHYSSKAFSKNGKDTIVSKQNVTKLGQREGFTEKDILKLNRMYEDSCNNIEDDNYEGDDVISWFKSLFH